MVNIIDCSHRVNKTYKILDNLDDILLCEDSYIHVGRKTELAVNAVTAHITQIIAFLREEEVIDYLSCACIIGRLCVTQQTEDAIYSLLLRVAGILVESVEDERVINSIGSIILLMQKNCLYTAVQDSVNELLVEDRLTLNYNLTALD